MLGIVTNILGAVMKGDFPVGVRPGNILGMAPSVPAELMATSHLTTSSCSRHAVKETTSWKNA